MHYMGRLFVYEHGNWAYFRTTHVCVIHIFIAFSHTHPPSPQKKIIIQVHNTKVSVDNRKKMINKKLELAKTDVMLLNYLMLKYILLCILIQYG